MVSNIPSDLQSLIESWNNTQAAQAPKKKWFQRQKTYDAKTSGAHSLLKKTAENTYIFENKFTARSNLGGRLKLQKEKKAYNFLENAGIIKDKFEKLYESNSLTKEERGALQKFANEYNENLIEVVKNKKAEKGVPLHFFKKIFQKEKYKQLLEVEKSKYEAVKLPTSWELKKDTSELTTNNEPLLEQNTTPLPNPNQSTPVQTFSSSDNFVRTQVSHVKRKKPLPNKRQTNQTPTNPKVMLRGKKNLNSQSNTQHVSEPPKKGLQQPKLQAVFGDNLFQKLLEKAAQLSTSFKSLLENSQTAEAFFEGCPVEDLIGCKEVFSNDQNIKPLFTQNVKDKLLNQLSSIQITGNDPVLQQKEQYIEKQKKAIQNCTFDTIQDIAPTSWAREIEQIEKQEQERIDLETSDSLLDDLEKVHAQFKQVEQQSVAEEQAKKLLQQASNAISPQKIVQWFNGKQKLCSDISSTTLNALINSYLNAVKQGRGASSPEEKIQYIKEAGNLFQQIQVEGKKIDECVTQFCQKKESLISELKQNVLSASIVGQQEKEEVAKNYTLQYQNATGVESLRSILEQQKTAFVKIDQKANQLRLQFDQKKQKVLEKYPESIEIETEFLSTEDQEEFKQALQSYQENYQILSKRQIKELKGATLDEIETLSGIEMDEMLLEKNQQFFQEIKSKIERTKLAKQNLIQLIQEYDKAAQQTRENFKNIENIGVNKEALNGVLRTFQIPEAGDLSLYEQGMEAVQQGMQSLNNVNEQISQVSNQFKTHVELTQNKNIAVKVLQENFQKNGIALHEKKQVSEKLLQQVQSAQDAEALKNIILSQVTQFSDIEKLFLEKKQQYMQMKDQLQQQYMQYEKQLTQVKLFFQQNGVQQLSTAQPVLNKIQALSSEYKQLSKFEFSSNENLSIEEYEKQAKEQLLLLKNQLDTLAQPVESLVKECQLLRSGLLDATQKLQSITIDTNTNRGKLLVPLCEVMQSCILNMKNKTSQWQASNELFQKVFVVCQALMNQNSEDFAKNFLSIMAINEKLPNSLFLKRLVADVFQEDKIANTILHFYAQPQIFQEICTVMNKEVELLLQIQEQAQGIQNINILPVRDEQAIQNMLQKTHNITSLSQENIQNVKQGVELDISNLQQCLKKVTQLNERLHEIAENKKWWGEISQQLQPYQQQFPWISAVNLQVGRLLQQLDNAQIINYDLQKVLENTFMVDTIENIESHLNKEELLQKITAQLDFEQLTLLLEQNTPIGQFIQKMELDKELQKPEQQLKAYVVTLGKLEPQSMNAGYYRGQQLQNAQQSMRNTQQLDSGQLYLDLKNNLAQYVQIEEREATQKRLDEKKRNVETSEEVRETPTKRRKN